MSEMDTLDGSDWDVVIAGTGFPQSLLALSLSRAGLRVLHVDANDYYGGSEAALSLAEAEQWAERFASNHTSSPFSRAVITRPETGSTDGCKLASSRAYSLALAPHLIYAQSNLISALVSSQTHNQLDFQAVGSWFVAHPSVKDESKEPRLMRVPNGREDVFQDTSLNLQAKRSLMKFLRFVSVYEEQQDKWLGSRDVPFPEFLRTEFGLPAESHEPILALTLSPQADHETSTGMALPRIARHLRSIGIFGPGFGAVLPKWGGLAEITQVACRACAVGGGVYVLGKGIKNYETATDETLRVGLTGGEKITTKWLASGSTDLALASDHEEMRAAVPTVASKAIVIVASPLQSLYPATSEGGVKPAGAVIVVPALNPSQPPVHILAHSSEAGECPSSQCILYASIAESLEEGHGRLDQAVQTLLQSVSEATVPQILWSMHYQQQFPSDASDVKTDRATISLPSLSASLSLEDEVLKNVKQVWSKITSSSKDEFMTFASREETEDSDES